MRFRFPLTAQFLAVVALTFVMSEARAECGSQLLLEGPTPVMARSPYDEATRVQSLDPALWFDDDRRIVEVAFSTSSAEPLLAGATIDDARAALSRIEIFVLRPELSERMLVELTLAEVARFLHAPSSPRIPVTWALAEHSEGIGSDDRFYMSATFALSPSGQLPPGEYWLVAAMWLPVDSKLGCPEISPEGVFSGPVRLYITTATTPKERAFVQYRRVAKALEVHAADERRPGHRGASPEQVALELDAALDAAKTLVAIDPNSSFGWEMLGKVHEARREAAPAIAAYRKAGESLAAGGPDIAPINEGSCWLMPSQRRPARLQHRIDALSLPEPVFNAWP